MANTPKTFTFKYLKNPEFKTYKIDGAYGGVTLKAEINLNFYLDTLDMPKSIVHALDSRGSIGPEITTEKKAESIRELCAGVVMDVTTAKSVVLWLNDKIKQAESAIEGANK